MLEHPLSGVYDVPHGAGLSIIIPAWLKYKKQEITHRILKFGESILGLKDLQAEEPAKAADRVIQSLLDWYQKIGTPTTFQEAGIKTVDIEKLTTQALELCRLWGVSGYTAEDIRQIYRLAAGS
jgi:alcohol dehydrogenase YqhD (iron-dependent ADH family)